MSLFKPSPKLVPPDVLKIREEQAYLSAKKSCRKNGFHGMEHAFDNLLAKSQSGLTAHPNFWKR